MLLEILVFTLILLALAIGWWLGSREKKRQPPSSLANYQLNNEYFAGLNHLLNEQPDEAIIAFSKALEINSDTVEIHLALGSLFRKRGESEKAVRLHQNLFARPSLTKEQSSKIQLELAKDFLAAGLLDRAENLLEQLSNKNSNYRQASQLLLIELYEKQQDWQQALNTLSAELLRNQPKYKKAAAHYCCELASQNLAENNPSKARKFLKQAANYDPTCVRSNLLNAQLELDRNNPKAALRYLHRIPEQNCHFLPLMLPSLIDAYSLLNQPKQLASSLEKLLQKYSFTSLALALANGLKNMGEHELALSKLESYLRHKPSLKGMDYLIDTYLHTASGEEKDHLLGLKNLTSQLLELKPNYQCIECGFASQQHFWHCPKCKNWGSHKPILGVEGE